VKTRQGEEVGAQHDGTKIAIDTIAPAIIILFSDGRVSGNSSIVLILYN